MTSLSTFPFSLNSSITRFKSLLQFHFTPYASLFSNFFLFISLFLPISISSITSLRMSSIASFHRSVLDADFGNSSEKWGLKPVYTVGLFFNLDGNTRKVRNVCSVALQTIRFGFYSAICTTHTSTPTTAVTLKPSSQIYSALGEIQCVPVHPQQHQWPSLYSCRYLPAGVYAWDRSVTIPVGPEIPPQPTLSSSKHLQGCRPSLSISTTLSVFQSTWATLLRPSTP